MEALLAESSPIHPWVHIQVGNTYREVKIYLIYNMMYSSYSQPAYIYIYISSRYIIQTHGWAGCYCACCDHGPGSLPAAQPTGEPTKWDKVVSGERSSAIPHSDWNTRIHVHIHIQPTEKSRENQKIIKKKVHFFPPLVGRSLAIRPIAIPNWRREDAEDSPPPFLKWIRILKTGGGECRWKKKVVFPYFFSFYKVFIFSLRFLMPTRIKKWPWRRPPLLGRQQHRAFVLLYPSYKYPIKTRTAS